MTIAHQSAMTEERVRARPSPVSSPHQLVLVEQESPARTLAKIACLVAIAALGMTLAIAIVAGGALFALLSFR